ncbi:probable serine/threonine-protein kinase At1g01540 [Impatiens glandulifera]|uniref:probable serine/threonine-protein kinase At1g01540 n=1 Tax=Impatiens glandulifera TaxID=253017 RepID=UPI001FB14032|nr:probable serine/threonine-protein kinase At1g01540 [Impatiens glandulifera]
MPSFGRSNSSFQDRRQLLMSRSGYPDIEMGIIGSNNMDHANEIRLSSAMNMSVPSWNRAGNGVFSLREMEVATNWFSDQNMMSGHDHYGFVYRGVLCDGTRVAVKKLQYSSGMAEDFMVKAEEIGDIQHKNVVELYGYCTESALRLLVYEYVDNGNVHWWLHECARLTSPLTWDIRLKIMLGTAKG